MVGRSLVGGSWVPEDTIKSSVVFQKALEVLPSHRVAWFKLEDVNNNQCLESRPFNQWMEDWNPAEVDGPMRCTLWILSPKMHWLASWADNLQHIVKLDPSLGSTNKVWAFQSTFLTELLGEEEGREIPLKGHASELRRCGASLTALARNAQKKENRVDFAELFSPPRVGPKAKERGLTVASKTFDLEAGWDVRKVDHRKEFRSFQQQQRPRFLVLSPECKAYSQLMNINWERMDPRKKEAIQSEGALMWNFSLEAAENQADAGDFFALEHPAGAESWKLERTQALLQRPDVAIIEFDLCTFGLSVVPSGQLSRKRTRIATNHPRLALELSLHQCQGDHEHVPLENNLAGKARIYPPALCDLLAQCAKEASLQVSTPSFLEFPLQPWSFAEGLPEDEEEEEPPHQTSGGHVEEDPLEKDVAQPKVTESQKRMVMKVHVNTGHPPLEQFLRMMRAGGAHSHVLSYIKNEFRCEQCMVNKPDNRRRAHCPRSFAFNRVVSIDVFYIKFQQKSIPILNMVCTGSNYQIAQRLPVPEGNVGAAPTSEVTWKHFLQTWIRFFGPPTMIICDSGSSRVVLREDASPKECCSRLSCQSVLGRTARPRDTEAG